MIGRSGEKGSGISVLAVRHDDDDDDDDTFFYVSILTSMFIYLFTSVFTNLCTSMCFTSLYEVHTIGFQTFFV